MDVVPSASCTPVIESFSFSVKNPCRWGGGVPDSPFCLRHTGHLQCSVWKVLGSSMSLSVQLLRVKQHRVDSFVGVDGMACCRLDGTARMFRKTEKWKRLEDHDGGMAIEISDRFHQSVRQHQNCMTLDDAKDFLPMMTRKTNEKTKKRKGK